MAKFESSEPLNGNRCVPPSSFPESTDEIYANLAGGKQFSTLDLRQSYLEMELEQESKPHLTDHTTRDLYQYQRLSYGVASAPAIWQRTMD